MIGIIAALDKEKDAIVELMKNVTTINHYGREYYCGTIADKETVVVVCGVGKVSSAIVTSQLIEKFKPDFVINMGVAGGTKDFENTLDTVVADKLTYHDYDTETIDGIVSTFETSPYVFTTDEQLNQIAVKAFEKIEGHKCYLAPIVSGDMFVSRESDVKRITETYPEAYAADMESVSVAHTCAYYNTKCVVIRSLSDIVVKDGNELTFMEFAVKACAIAAQFTVEFFKLI